MEKLITFENGGQKLFGMLHKPDDDGPYPGVAMFHGFTGQRCEPHRLFVKTARDLMTHGIAVLRFDFRGSGESEGRFQDATVDSEIADALAALEFLSAEENVASERLGVIGLSLGGCIAACVAGRSPRVKTVTLWSAVGLMDEVFTQMTDDLGDRAAELSTLGAIDMGGNLVGLPMIQTAQAARPVQEIASFDGPVLIVHGTADDVVPPKHAEAYHAAVKGEKRLVWIEGANHTFDSYLWEKQLIETTRDWLLAHL